MARRRKSAKKRRGKGSTDSSSSIHNSASSEHMETGTSLQAAEDVDSLNCTEGEIVRRGSRRGTEAVEEEDEEAAAASLLRLPEMTDTSMDNVGQPLCDVMDQLNGALDGEEAWEHLEENEKNNDGFCHNSEPPAQQPFREDCGGEPPDPTTAEMPLYILATAPNFLQTSPAPTDLCCFTPRSPISASQGCGHHDSSEHGQSQTHSGGHEDEGEAKTPAGQEPSVNMGEEQKEDRDKPGDSNKDGFSSKKIEELQEEKQSPSESSHPAEFK